MRAFAVPTTMAYLLATGFLAASLPGPALAQTQPPPGAAAPSAAPVPPSAGAPMAPAARKSGGACSPIIEACVQAGFSTKGWSTGTGLVVDCIRPIVNGTPQRRMATKPLPQVDPQIVATCKAKNPKFGQASPPKLKPAAPPAAPGMAPPAAPGAAPPATGQKS